MAATIEKLRTLVLRRGSSVDVAIANGLAAQSQKLNQKYVFVTDHSATYKTMGQ
ncbi:hypothetical protein MMAR_0588 [Mycobacterium marinum M]|uniref:Uncharacterized protein n=1 Tax=Mycobacterium marinum (strain ATCC BAA-535 / M) TaxID=216594 RepID=B2HP10_MYCMM|nr:hypothetical protein MMAR_0588 [Mycobacterium marinum M]